MSYKYLFLVAGLLSLIGAFVAPQKKIVHAANPTIDRSMYIWSATETTYGAEYIKNYLVSNNITTAVASGSNKTVFKQLLTILPPQGIKVELLIGSNSLLTNPDPTAYFDNILKGIDTKNISALHLDVEPHTFDDYQTKKEYYLSLYVQLLKTAKMYATQKGMKLSVDIPVFYPEATVKEIYKQADTVYLMAYQITSMNYLATRVSEELTQGKEKTVIAFRANDFAKRSDFETYLKNASTKLNMSTFAMHDLSRFVNLPQ